AIPLMTKVTSLLALLMKKTFVVLLLIGVVCLLKYDEVTKIRKFFKNKLQKYKMDKAASLFSLG
ncbi:MAG: hypothetical protein ACOCRK_07285, partial [bacterium]